MIAAPIEETGEPRELAPDALTWRVWPWALFLPAAPLLALAFVGLFAYAAFGARDGVWAVLVAVSAWVVLGEFVVPVGYAMDEQGVAVSGALGPARRYTWSAFEGYRIPQGGRVVALRFRGGGPMRWWRRDLNVFVPQDEDLRTRLERRLSEHLGPAA